MRIIFGLPLLIFVLIAYNVFAFGAPAAFTTALVQWNMLSGAVLNVYLDDVMIFAGLVALFIEVVKAARSAASTIIDHMLSTAVFIGGLVEFLLVKQVGTPVYLLLVTMCFIDVVAGYTISIKSARRDFAIGPDIGA